MLRSSSYVTCSLVWLYYGSTNIFGNVAARLWVGNGTTRYLVFVMVLASGLSKSIFYNDRARVVAVAVMWLFVFKEYQKARLLNFVDPARDIRGSGYNVFQAEIAIGSGQILGKGVGYGTQSRLSFLPEHETDFIFAAFAEEWGFVGVVLVLILFGTLCARLLISAYRARNNFEALLAMGVLGFIFIRDY